MTAAPDYKSLYEQSQLDILQLKQQLAQLQKMIFGSRQERFIAEDVSHPQMRLQLGSDAVAAPVITSSKEISYTRHTIAAPAELTLHPGRMRLPDSLRREIITIEPEEDTAGCRRMNEEITEVLEYQPGELYVKQYRRVKYARPDNSGVLIGQLPSRPLEKAMAGEGLLSQIVIDKFVDHLPLHRQMQRFERSGVKLAYSTLTDWVSNTCELISPLFEALKKEVLASGYLHADETPIKVLDKDKKGQTHRGFYWVYQDSIAKTVLFDYQEGRGREGPSEILRDFQGYLQTDGYVAYNSFAERKGVTLLHCLAHARRKFSDALQNNETVAGYALQEIQKLYAIERECKERQLSFDQIKEVRQTQSAPILQTLGRWMREQYTQNLTDNATREALAYSVQRWNRLSLYIADGRLNIDNNPVENSIRPVAIGRKNYLFAGSHQAATRSGMLYSLLGTCKMHGIEPYAWLKDVLHRIPKHPVNRVAELLPHHILQ
jgi:transposase